jgi:hypothetical protein
MAGFVRTRLDVSFVDLNHGFYFFARLRFTRSKTARGILSVTRRRFPRECSSPKGITPGSFANILRIVSGESERSDATCATVNVSRVPSSTKGWGCFLDDFRAGSSGAILPAA